VKLFLIRTLKPGDIVIVGNLSGHKGAVVRAAVRDGPGGLFPEMA
jgi:2-keto-4-pentenoate hydratase/2-oxohepta-3-ene-1,7-dioic acid hydratase in catechol pathway